MENFCGSDFWNESLTWDTKNPDFTPCFEKTVLVWIPCLFLWLSAPVHMHFCIRNKDRDIQWTFLNLSKLIVSCILIIDMLVLLFMNISNGSFEEYNIHGVDYLAPGLLAVTLILQAVFVYIEKKKGVQSSWFIFIFWLLMAIFSAPAYRTQFLYAKAQDNYSNSVSFITYMIFYPCVFLMFVLSLFADKAPSYIHYPRGSNACPEHDASFLNHITFSWLDGLIWKGFRNPITQKMLWDLTHENSSEKVIKDWDRYWQASLRKSYREGESETRVRFTNDGNEVNALGIAPNRKHYISILPTMIKTFGLQFAAGSSLKLFHDILQFVSPMLISVLITFTEELDSPTWHGYLYAFLLLVVTQLQSLFLGQYFLRMYLVGLKIRTAVISAIYRKALRVSNSARKESTVGEIVNLMSVDAQRFMDLMTYLNMIWSAPLQIGLSMYFLWRILGPSVLAGLAVLIILIPVNGFIANMQKKLQIKQMKYKDHRVKLMNEILNGMRVLKLYAWEPSFEEQVLEVRRKEIKVLKKAAYLNAGTSFIWTCTPFMVTFFMFMTYVLSSSDHILTPDIVFVSISLLNIMRMPMTILPFMVVALVQASVSLKRMNKFLNADELDPNAVIRDEAGSSDSAVSIENGTFSWGHGKDDNDVLRGINLKVKKGTLVGIVGTVGAGKSSMCSAMLGQMEKNSGQVRMKGSLAYVAQQAWIQNETLENNILFGKKSDISLYKRVVKACALKQDFEMLPAGDQTEIGEKGINLSGGQKQRVSLARAVYADSEVFLLDDPLSAVDAHVGKHIFEKVIGPQGLLKKKTRIFVTHGLTYLRHMDHIAVMKNGEISEQGTYAQLIEKKGEFQEFLLQYLLQEEDEEIDDLEELKLELGKSMGKEIFDRQISQISRQRQESECSIDSRNSNASSPEKCLQNSPLQMDESSMNGSIRRRKKMSQSEGSMTIKPPEKIGEKLIEAEKAETGRVSRGVYGYYIRAIGIVATVLTIIFYAASQGFSVGSNIWLSIWSGDNSSNITYVRNKYLGVYGALGIMQAVTVLVGAFMIYYGAFLAAVKLHTNLLGNLMRLPMHFFDTNPIGRLLNRLSKDIDILDNTLPWNVRSWLMCVGQLFSL